jgi:membrane fusion protein, hemolysin D
MSEPNQPKRSAAARRRTAEMEFLPAALEVLEKPPSPIGRAVSITMMLFAALAIGWMYYSEMDVVVTAQGQVVPSGHVKLIQAAEAGVVRAIKVRDGQLVRQGEELIELDSTTTSADRARLAREQLEARIEVARLKAQLASDPGLFLPPADIDASIADTQRSLLVSRLQERNEKLAGLDHDIARRRAERDAIRSMVVKLEKTLPLMRKRLEKNQSLARQQFLSELKLMDNELEVINQENELEIQRHRLAESEESLEVAIRQRNQMQAEFKAETLAALAEASRRDAAVTQELIKVEKKKSLQRLHAPIDGVVQQLAVNTIGGVITAAQTLMVIVPAEGDLEIDAKVLNKDIGFVRVGQRAAVKFETYQFTRHGFIEGTMQWVGNDAMSDPKLGLVFPVRILLADTKLPNVVNGRRGIVAPGMAVTADIAIGSRRVLEYFLAPILRYKQESLRER